MQKAVDHPRCLVLRDQDSIESLKKRLEHSRRILLVGNGGIALELVHALRGVEVRDPTSMMTCQQDSLCYQYVQSSNTD